MFGRNISFRLWLIRGAGYALSWVACATAGFAQSPAGLPDDPAAFVGSRLATHDTSSRLALIFSRRFVYDIKISPDRRVARIVWPGDKIEFNEGIIWKTDDRLAAIRAVARGGEWVEVELKASTAFESISDFWAPDSPTLILDIATEPAAPALTPGINAQAQQSGGLMPAPLPEIGPQARRGTSAGAVPISLLAVGAEQTRARSLEEREAELRDFFMKLSEAFGQQDKRLALMVNNREWDNAADELLDRLQKNPGAPESLVWLFLNAEFRYRAMEELAGPPEDTLEAFNLFINQAPENHELAPYAFYRMAEAAGRLKLAPEEIAYITSARSGPPTPFDDLFLLYQARVCIGDGRDWDARKVLWQLVKQYPRSPLRAESEYLLGELEWRQDTDEGRLQGYEHFRSMLDVTTAPLRARCVHSPPPATSHGLRRLLQPAGRRTAGGDQHGAADRRDAGAAGDFHHHRAAAHAFCQDRPAESIEPPEPHRARQH